MRQIQNLDDQHEQTFKINHLIFIGIVAGFTILIVLAIIYCPKRNNNNNNDDENKD